MQARAAAATEKAAAAGLLGDLHERRGDGSPNRVKVVAVLKPFTLSADVNPPELRNWIDEFSAYHRASKLHFATIGEQQQYLFRCLDRKLSARLRLLIEGDTPVLSENDGEITCLQVLHDDIMRKWPLFIRRVKFFRRDQQAGETLGT